MIELNKCSCNISDEIPCHQDNPCQNGGTCSGTILSYNCSCDVGYTGINCDSTSGSRLFSDGVTSH